MKKASSPTRAAIFSSTVATTAITLPASLFGAAAAGYSAFLFGQAEGRDFWQGPLMVPILLTQATLAGAAAPGLLAWALNADIAARFRGL